MSLGPTGGLSVQWWTFGGRTRRSPDMDGDNHLYPGPGVAFGADVLVSPVAAAAGTCIPVALVEHGTIYRRIDQQEDELSGQEDTSDDHYKSYVRCVFALQPAVTTIGFHCWLYVFVRVSAATFVSCG